MTHLIIPLDFRVDIWMDVDLRMNGGNVEATSRQPTGRVTVCFMQWHRDIVSAYI